MTDASLDTKSLREFILFGIIQMWYVVLQAERNRAEWNVGLLKRMKRTRNGKYVTKIKNLVIFTLYNIVYILLNDIINKYTYALWNENRKYNRRRESNLNPSLCRKNTLSIPGRKALCAKPGQKRSQCLWQTKELVGWRWMSVRESNGEKFKSGKISFWTGNFCGLKWIFPSNVCLV